MNVCIQGSSPRAMPSLPYHSAYAQFVLRPKQLLNVPRARGKGEKAKDKCSTGGNNIGNLMLPWKMQRNPGVCALYIFAFLAKQRFYSFPLLGRGNCTGKVKSIYTFSRTKQINKKAKPVKSYPPFFGQECFPLLCMMCVLIGTVGHICWWQ